MNKLLSKYTTLLFLALALVFTGCDSDDENSSEESYDEQAILTNLADNLIIPSFEELKNKSSDLKNASDAAIAETSVENIEDLKSAWEECLLSWQWASLYDFGPSSDNGLVATFNLFPVNTDLINSNIASGNYNLESAANLSANGLQAIDYLLFGTADSNEDLVSYFESNPNALVYIQDIATLMSTKANSAYNAWNGDYRSTFVNATGTSIGSSLGLMITGAIRYFEIHLRDGKIGIPAGARSISETPLPEQAEAIYNGSVSKSMLYENLTAWQYFFNGRSITGIIDGEGLDDFLDFEGTTFDGQPLADELNNRFDQTLLDIVDLSPNIADAVVTEQEACLDVFDEMQRILVLLKVDMTAALGVQITYVDNDGD